MVDILGRELQVGQLVFSLNGGSGAVTLAPAIVVGFTNTLVILSYYWQMNRERKRGPNHLMIASVQEIEQYRDYHFVINEFGNQNEREETYYNYINEMIEKHLNHQ
jgi:hypothetical protein